MTIDYRRKSAGFTLVEIIVVLVILAILAVLLIPALTGYIDKAKDRALQMEARQAVMAMQTLTSEAYGLGGDMIADTSKTDSYAGVGDGSGNKSIYEKIYGQAVALADVPGDIVFAKQDGGKVVQLLYERDGKNMYYAYGFFGSSMAVATAAAQQQVISLMANNDDVKNAILRWQKDIAVGKTLDSVASDMYGVDITSSVYKVEQAIRKAFAAQGIATSNDLGTEFQICKTANREFKVNFYTPAANAKAGDKVNVIQYDLTLPTGGDATVGEARNCTATLLKNTPGGYTFGNSYLILSNVVESTE